MVIRRALQQKNLIDQGIYQDALGQPRLTNPTLGVFVGESASLIPLLSQFLEAGAYCHPTSGQKALDAGAKNRAISA